MKKLILPIFMCLIINTNLTIASECNESIITVDNSLTQEIAPDTVKIRFYVENTGLNVADLKEKNDKIVHEAISKIKTKLKENEQIKTIAYRINDVYSYKDKVRIFQKYEVINGFEVKLKDLDKTSEIIKIATDSGIKRVDGINFSIENTNAICNEMLAQCSKEAKARAQHVAQTLGHSLDKPKSINPHCSLNGNVVSAKRYATMMNAQGATEDSITPVIEPGTINARASVNMTYYLK